MLKFCDNMKIGETMKFYKTLFFEIPSKDFIMPVYSEDDVNTLKSFLDEDEVQFSVGYKSKEDEKGYYYIGQVKEFTEIFRLGDFPLVYRKRVMDVLNGLRNDSKIIVLDLREKVVQKLVYFKMTKDGLKPFISDYNLENVDKLEKINVKDYFIKDEKIWVASQSFKSEYLHDEFFYYIKNPNY